ncbi:MAG: hypothetical protein IKZ94_04575, partial [Lachnospiraceae bacterium]|nr:hypothetical protein [Lachnospiraceae bacterium]
MKKRISFLLILGLSISLLGACGKNTNDTSVTSNQEDNASEATATETPKEAEEVTEEAVDDTVYLLTASSTSDSIYFVKGDGSVINTIKRSDIEAKIPEADRKTYDVNNDTEYQRSELVAEGDGFLFFRDGYYDSSKNVYKIFAIREEDYKIYDIEEYDRDLFVKAFDYYAV